MPDHNPPAAAADTPPPRIEAEGNVWYRLATVTDDHEENRRLWNVYMSWWLSSEDKEWLTDRDGKRVAFPPVTGDDIIFIAQNLGHSFPSTFSLQDIKSYLKNRLSKNIDFSYTNIIDLANFSGFIFPHYTKFSYTIFERRVYFKNTIRSIA